MSKLEANFPVLMSPVNNFLQVANSEVPETNP